MRKVDMVNIVRCHRQGDSLERALFQSIQWFPCPIDLYTVLVVNRPSEEVLKIVERYKKFPAVSVITPDIKMEGLKKSGAVLLNAGLQYIDDAGIVPKWIWQQDDAEVLGPGFGNTLPELLDANDDTLAYTTNSLYIWEYDKIPMVNLNMFHYNTIIFRYMPGHRYSLIQGNQHTKEVQKKVIRNPFRKKPLPFYVLDYSGDSKEKRKNILADTIGYNVIDDFIKGYMEEPQLVNLFDILQSKVPPLDLAFSQMKRKGLAY